MCSVFPGMESFPFHSLAAIRKTSPMKHGNLSHYLLLSLAAWAVGNLALYFPQENRLCPLEPLCTVHSATPSAVFLLSQFL